MSHHTTLHTTSAPALFEQESAILKSHIQHPYQLRSNNGFELTMFFTGRLIQSLLERPYLIFGSA